MRAQTLSTNGDRTVLTYTTLGNTTLTVPPGVTSVDYVIVGGGGGGGNNRGGGGGAGGVRVGTLIPISAQRTYIVVVGSGGDQGEDGGHSVVVNPYNGDSIIADGGGHGGSIGGGGADGGSGGGHGAATNLSPTFSNPVMGDPQGSGGGGADNISSYGAGGGGGGFSGGGGFGLAGSSAALTNTGGPGYTESLTGLSLGLAGGGGGGVQRDSDSVLGGAAVFGFGGGNGSGTATAGNGAPSTGGGGGGGGSAVVGTGYNGGSGGSGIVILSYVTPNDHFADRRALPGETSAEASASNAGATKDSGEPNHAGDAGGHSLWWSWTAPATGLYAVSTNGSSFDTLLAVYTGTAVGSLTPVASNDDFEGTTSSLTFAATAGATYQIAIDGKGGATGQVVLTLVLSDGAPTLEPVFASAFVNENVTFDFPASFQDPDCGELSSLTVVTLPATGTLQLSGVPVTAGQVIASNVLGNLVYVPVTNATGVQTFTVTVSDGTVSSDPATVTITVTAVPSSIVVVSVSAETFIDANGEITLYVSSSLPPGATVVGVDLSLEYRTDWPPENPAISGNFVSLNGNDVVGPLGWASVGTGGNWQSLTRQYRGPLPGYHSGGENNWRIASAWNPTTVRNVVFRVYYTGGVIENQPPVLAPIAVSGIVNTTVTFTAATFTSAYSDAENSPLVAITINSLPEIGTLKLSGIAVTNGQTIFAEDFSHLTYEPAPDTFGSLNFSVRASDGTSQSEPAIVTITITPPPDTTPPTLTFVSIASNNPTPGLAAIGDTVTLTFSASEPLTASGGATLRGWYPLDGNGSDPTSTGPVLEQPGGAVSFVPGLAGGAASFDGSGSTWLRAQINASGDTTPTFTWGAWIKLDNRFGPGIYISNDNDGWDRFLASFTNWTVSLGGFAVSSYEATEEWTFVAQTFDGTTQKLYVDGNPAFVTGDPGNQSMQSFIDLGRNANGAYPLHGLMDGVFFFGDTLTDEQIATIRTGGPGGSGVLSVAGKTVTATIAGHPVIATHVEGSLWTASVTVAPGDASGVVPFSIAFSDTAGNAGTPVTATTNGSSVTVDATGPTGTRALPTAGVYGIGQALNFTVTYSEPVYVTGTPTMTLYLGEHPPVFPAYVSGSGTTTLVFRYIVAAGDDGTISLPPFVGGEGSIRDLAGNSANSTLAGPQNSGSVRADGSPPYVVSITRQNASPTSASSVGYSVVFSENVTGVDVTDFTLSFTGGTTASIANVTGGGTTFAVTVNSVAGTGTLRLDLKNSGTGITDSVANAIAGGFADGESYAITNSAPTLGPITIAGTEDLKLNLPAASFTAAYADAESDPLVSITVVTLPVTGRLDLAGTPVTVGQVIPVADLGNLSYQPAPDESGAKTFTVSASDGAQSAAAATVTLNLAAVNDAPSAGGGALLVYETVTPFRVDDAIAYTINNAAALAGVPFSRVRYRMELTVEGVLRYADVSFDAWEGLTVAGLQVPSPTVPGIVQRNVSNLTVASNYPGVVNATGQTGRLEIWPYSYDTDANGNVGGDNGTYDFDDRPSDDLRGYGSFQVHNLSAGPQTVLAWNNHNGNPEIGFGNGLGSQPDWTFSAPEGKALGSEGWKLQIYIVPAGAAQDFTVAEDTVANLQFSGTPFTDVDSSSLTVTLSVADGTLTGNVSEGVIVGGTATARTFAGTVAALNAYFTTAGKITYQPALNQTAPRILTISVNDSALTTEVTSTITILPVNDAPVMSAIAVNGTEGAPLVFTAANFTTAFSDPDGTSLVSLTVATLPATGTLLLSGSPVTAAQVIDAAQLGNLTYVPAPFENGPKTFTVTASDGVLSSNVATVTMTLAPVNDAPVNTAPIAVVLAEDAPFAFTGSNALSVADADGNLATTRLTVTHGTLAVSLAGGATISSGAIGSATFTLAGTGTQINAALATLVYTPTADYNGFDSLAILSTDTNALTDSDAIGLSIAPVADIVADTLTTAEDTPIAANVLTGTNGASADSFENAGAILTGVTQGANGTVSFTAAGVVTYTPAPDFNGPDSFTYTVTSGGVTETASVTVNVTPVNDAPVNVVPLAQTTSSNIPLVFSAAQANAIMVTDVEGPTLTVTLTATNGTVTLSTLTGLTFSIGDGTADPTIRATGSISALNAALNGLVFTPANNFAGPATLTLATSDNGNTGAGGVLTDTDVVTINVSDAVPPTVAGLDSVTPAGAYGVGAVIDVRVTFSESVTVNTAGGTPTLLLETGTTDRPATYLGGSGTAALIFRYLVASGDTSEDLDHHSVGAFFLNGAVIQDLSGNPAILDLPATTPGTPGALATNAALLIDTTAPALAISAPSVPSTGTGPVTFTLTYADTHLFTISLTAPAITLVTTSSGAGFVAPNGSVTVTGSGNTRTVTISGITGDGTLAISVAAGTATDLAGNTAPAAGPSATVAVQNTFPIVIVAQPKDLAVAVGTPLLLDVAAQGTALTYQWTKDTVPIAGATNSTYELLSAPLTAAGVYRVVVTNPLGSVTSSPGNVAVFDVSATHAVAGFGYVAGQTVTVRNTVVFSGGDGTLSWHLLLPPGWSYVNDDADSEAHPAPGATELLEWSWLSFPLSPVTFTAQLRVPAGATGVQSLSAQVLFTRGGSTVPLLAKPDPLTMPEIGPYSGDSDHNGRIDLPELLRLIELYNTRNLTNRTGAYAVAQGSEDGFNPDYTRAAGVIVPLTSYHSADSNHDGRIDVFELTRVIELYNYRVGTVRTGEYHRQTGTEDGYASGPAPSAP